MATVANAEFWYEFTEGQGHNKIVGWHNPFTRETVRLNHKGDFLTPQLRSCAPGAPGSMTITIKGQPRRVCYQIQDQVDLAAFDRELIHKVRTHRYFQQKFEQDCTKLHPNDCNANGCVLLESETWIDKARQWVPFMSSSGKTCMELEPLCQKEETQGLGSFRNVFKNQSNLRTLEERCDLKGLVEKQRMWRYGMGAATAAAAYAGIKYLRSAPAARAAPAAGASEDKRWDALR